MLREKIGDLTNKINDLFILEEDLGPSKKKKFKKSDKSTDKSVVKWGDKDILELIQQNQVFYFKLF